MKKDIHPDNYRLCVFKDMSTDYAILTKSCAETKDTIKWEDGNEYPLFKMEISSDSHPFFTAGRIDKFKNKYKKFQK
jgi:large subunit ribosomal protein L31